ncbi:MAG TPA: PaaI family thioesterase [Bryobacteraceae bacterium]|nr:PaaI family thioesterase [Bryobacteraceae bacterium]
MCATIEAGANGTLGNAGRRQALLNSACVVCGAGNPTGLRLRFHCSPHEVSAQWRPTAAWESFQGVIHGGIITTVLDEAMSKAIIARGCEALTAELRVRFRKQVSPGDALCVRGWVVEKRKRRILAEAVLSFENGDELAHAWATFLVLPGAVC